MDSQKSQKGSRKNKDSKRPVIENYFPTGLQHQFELWVLHFNEQEIIRYSLLPWD